MATFLGLKTGGKPSPAIDTLIGRNTEIVGDIRFTGGLHIDGTVRGNVLAEDGSPAKLTVSDKARIEGEVRVPHMTLNGEVRGDVHSTEFLELSEHARVTGDVRYEVLKMNAGAEVNGKLLHGVDKAKAPVKLIDKKQPAAEPQKDAAVSKKPADGAKQVA